MREALKQKRNKKGFTLAELLIVVAIIAILAAIAFPVFSAQLAKAKAGADLANLRSGLSIASIALMGDKTLDEGELATEANEALGTPAPQYGSGGFAFVLINSPDDTTTKIVDRDNSTFGGKKLAELIAAAGGKEETTG